MGNAASWLGAWARSTAQRLRATTWAERIAVVLALAAVTFSIYTGMVELNRQGRSREVLAQVKAARLAGSAIAASCYASGAPFADQTTPDGFAFGVAAQIITLGRLPGDVTLLQIDENGYTIRRLLYQEDEFFALYDAVDGFSVWRQDPRLDYAPTTVVGGA